MKSSIKKKSFLSIFILHFCLFCCIFVPNVAAVFNISVGDTWTYYYSGSRGEGNIVIEVTSVNPDGPIIGNEIPDFTDPTMDMPLDSFYIVPIEMVNSFITGGITPELLNYAGEDRLCINCTSIYGSLIIIDVITGILVEMNYTNGYYLLIDWSISGGSTEAEWLVEVGDQWLYNNTINNNFSNTISVNITQVPSYPLYPQGIVKSDGFPPQMNVPLNQYVSNNVSINLYIISAGGTHFGTYGGVLCEYVIHDGGSGTVRAIDIATGVTLEMNKSMETGVQRMILISWAIPELPDAEWLVDTSYEWTYQLALNESMAGTTSIDITDVPNYPNSPLGTVYTNYYNPKYNQELNTYILDNYSIDYWIPLVEIDDIDYGGRLCNCAIITNLDYYDKIVFDIDTGIILEMDMNSSGMSVNIILISWLIAPPISEWLVDVADAWTYDVYQEGINVAGACFTITAIDPYLGYVNATYYLIGLMHHENYPISNFLVYDNATIAAAALNGTFSQVYGGKLCDCVEIYNIDFGVIFIVDTETGIAVEFTIQNINLTSHFILNSWDAPYNYEGSVWLVELGEQFTFEQYINDTYQGTNSYVITDIPEPPDYPLTTWYQNYTNPQSGKPLSPPIILDNNSLEYMQSRGTLDIRDYGGKQCNCVIVENYFYKGIMIFNVETGILLEADISDPISPTTINITLISWSLFPSGINISIISPLDSEVFGSTAPEYTVIITEANIHTTWYTLNGGGPIYITAINGENIGTIDTTAWKDLEDGPVVIKFYVNNTFGNLGSDTVKVIKETLAPNISITLPIDTGSFGSTAPEYAVTITEANIHSAWYTLNGGEPIYFTAVNGENTGTIDTTAWNDLKDGPVVITFYLNDTGGKEDSDDVIVYKDTSKPIISITSPTYLEFFNNTYPNFNITIIESNLSSTWYILNGGDPIYFTSIEGINIGMIDTNAWDSLEDGKVVITFYAEDIYGNIGQDEIIVIKNTSEPGPPTVPGYDIFIIIGTTGVVSCAIMLIKIRKRAIT